MGIYKSLFKKIEVLSFDLILTLSEPTSELLDSILKDFPLANIIIVENRGRDILPFIMSTKL